MKAKLVKESLYENEDIIVDENLTFDDLTDKYPKEEYRLPIKYDQSSIVDSERAFNYWKSEFIKSYGEGEVITPKRTTPYFIAFEVVGGDSKYNKLSNSREQDMIDYYSRNKA